MDIACRPSACIEVLSIDVPAGHIEPNPDCYHVLDLHAGEPVGASIRLDGHASRGPQHYGDINILPAGSTGRWHFEGQANALLLRLAPAVFIEAAEAMNVRLAALHPAVSVRDSHIENIAWMLKDETLAGYPRVTLWLETAAHSIALRLLRRSFDSSRPPPLSARSLPKWRLRRVCDYIETNLDQDLSLTELAATAGFSVPHFKVLFRGSMGLPVHRYVVERRVERARQLIVNGECSMTNIAHEVGFSHLSHMIRSVHRVLGISPAEIVALYRSSPKRAMARWPRRVSGLDRRGQ